MKIILWEIRKIFNWKILLIMAILAGMLFYMFINYGTKYFPNGRDASDEFILANEMLIKYGNNMDSNDIADFKQEFEKEKLHFAELAKVDPICKAAGVASYDDWTALEEKMWENEQAQKHHSEIIFGNKTGKELQDLLWRFQVRENYISQYDYLINEYETNVNLSQEAIDRFRGSPVLFDVLPNMVYSNYSYLSNYIFILMILLIAVCICPMGIADKLRNMEQMQYSSKIGRRIFNKKRTAAIICALFIYIVCTSYLLLAITKNGLWSFSGSSINSYFTYRFSWFELTFGQYIFATIALMPILAVATSLLCYNVSKLMGSYTGAIAINIPIVAGFIYLITLIFGDLQSAFTIGRFAFAEVVIYLAVFAFGIGASIYLGRKNRKCDSL